MTVREIIYIDDPKLRQKAKKIKEFGPHLKKLADDMLETMHGAYGVGLAAPQVGILQRLFVVQLPPDEEDPDADKPLVFVNPEFTYLSEEMDEGQEGCLSIPGWAGLVNRHYEVEVKAQNVWGKRFKIKASGFLARVFQHENDHLDGVLFTDHIQEADKLWKVKPGEEEEEVPEGEKIEINVEME